MSEPLSGLQNVPWENKTHAYGRASDVPALLRALREGDARVREDAWWKLHGNLWHQGTIYEATECAVPFLIELLKSEDTPDKARILVYLGALFLGESEVKTHEEQTRTAILQGAAAYVARLREGTHGEQVAAAHLLGLLRLGAVADEPVIEEIGRIAFA